MPGKIRKSRGCHIALTDPAADVVRVIYILTIHNMHYTTSKYRESLYEKTFNVRSHVTRTFGHISVPRKTLELKTG